MTSSYYILAPNCIIVKGFTRSILVDLQRNSFKPISKSETFLLEKPITDQTIGKLSKKKKETINILIKEEILIFVNKAWASSFKTINSRFYNSTKINNCIIELGNTNLKFGSSIRNSLNNLGCKFLELRVENDVTIEGLENLLELFSNTTITSIDIYFPYQNKNTYHDLLKLRKNIFEFRWIYLYNVPQKSLKELLKEKHSGTFLTSKKLIDSKNCGNISQFYFSINIPTYTEAKNFNTCLNCKVSIDLNGKIKNCPSMRLNYGDLKTTSIEEVVRKKAFNKVGNIRKDEIKGCRDCEFRYICTDCRAYTDDPNDLYSKPLKCGYDPYTGKWEEWSKNPLKQNSIKHYQLPQSDPQNKS